MALPAVSTALSRQLGPPSVARGSLFVALGFDADAQGRRCTCPLCHGFHRSVTSDRALAAGLGAKPGRRTTTSLGPVLTDERRVALLVIPVEVPVHLCEQRAGGVPIAGEGAAVLRADVPPRERRL